MPSWYSPASCEGFVAEVGRQLAEDADEAFRQGGAAFAGIAKGVQVALVAQDGALFVIGHQHGVGQALQAVRQKAVELGDLLGGYLYAVELGRDGLVRDAGRAVGAEHAAEQLQRAGLAQQTGGGSRQAAPVPERVAQADGGQCPARGQPPAQVEGQQAHAQQQAVGHGHHDEAHGGAGAVEQQHGDQHEHDVEGTLQAARERLLGVAGDQCLGGSGVQFQSGDAAGFGVFEGADEEVARADGCAAQQHLASLQLQR